MKKLEAPPKKEIPEKAEVVHGPEALFVCHPEKTKKLFDGKGYYQATVVASAAKQSR